MNVVQYRTLLKRTVDENHRLKWNEVQEAFMQSATLGSHITHIDNMTPWEHKAIVYALVEKGYLCSFSLEGSSIHIEVPKVKKED